MLWGNTEYFLLLIFVHRQIFFALIHFQFSKQILCSCAIAEIPGLKIIIQTRGQMKNYLGKYRKREGLNALGALDIIGCRDVKNLRSASDTRMILIQCQSWSSIQLIIVTENYFCFTAENFNRFEENIVKTFYSCLSYLKQFSNKNVNSTP